MNAKLSAITKSCVEGIETSEELVVYLARISNPENQLNTETGPKLIKYCIKNKHWSIFDQVDMTVEVKTSRAIAAQILRHSSLKIQEFSQRYSEVSGVLEPIELRLQGKTNRQVGEDILENVELEKEVNDLQQDTLTLYNKLIEKGVSKESARFILPLNIETTLYLKGSVRSWLTYLNLRLHQHSQKEHRLLAQEIANIFIEQFPIISSCFNNFETAYEENFIK